MLHRDRQLRLSVYQVIDGGVFALGLWVGWMIRYNWRGLPFAGLDHPDPIKDFNHGYFLLFLVILPAAPVILEWQSYYERPIFAPRRQTYWMLAKSCFIAAVFVIFLQFVLRLDMQARGVLALFGVCSFVLMVLKSELLRWVYGSKLGQEQLKRRVILIGTAPETAALRQSLATTGETVVVAEFDLNRGSIEKLVGRIHDESVNTIIINARNTVLELVEPAIFACELEGIEVLLLADFFKTQISRTSLDDFFGRPVFVFHSGPEMPWSRVGKMFIDFFGALAALAVFAIPMILSAIAIKWTSKGPLFFKQKRSGLNGKPFVMYKFRSMVTNAEQLKQELAALNEMSGPVFKVTNDPRVTKVGRFLRKSSLDECPQLFNVLRGEMSLVGPRPLPVDEVARFDDVAHRRRLSVKPGLTCLWQVAGRNDVKDFKEWVRLDLKYIDEWTLGLDIKILWRTIWVVLRGKGAS